MTRRNSGSYRHHIRRVAPGCYEISWAVDYHYPDSRLRFPRTMSRETDKRGAERFCKRWGLAMPESNKPAGEAP